MEVRKRKSDTIIIIMMQTECFDKDTDRDG